MNGLAKRIPRVATPWLALLTLLVAGAAEPLFAQRTASGTRSSSAGKSGSTSGATSSSGGSSRGATATASPSTGSTDRTAVRTRQSTPASRGQNRRFFGGRGHHHFGLGIGYGYGWGGYRGYYYPYYHYPFYWGVPYYVPRRARTEDELGALDLNVRPKKVEVYLDGQYIGSAGQFDGFPGYLWLEGGTYEVIFYRPGLATTKRILTVHPGVVLDVRLRLPAGESVDPAELSTFDREGALAEVRSAYERQQQAASAPTAARGAELDTRTAPGRVRLKVLPADASVYLDGRFLGSGSELAALHAGLVVAAGNHLLEIVRPGYPSESKQFKVEAGEDVELEVLLASPRGDNVGG